jgi:hypothetical protein
MLPKTDYTGGTPLDDHLLRIAKRRWGWEDALIVLMLAGMYFVQPASEGILLVFVICVVSLAHQRVTRRLDAVAQLLERASLRSK